jgi:hypothetical protein
MKRKNIYFGKNGEKSLSKKNTTELTSKFFLASHKFLFFAEKVFFANFVGVRGPMLRSIFSAIFGEIFADFLKPR